METVSVSALDTRLGTFWLASTDRGLLRLSTHTSRPGLLLELRRAGLSVIENSSPVIKDAKKQVVEYLERRRTRFTVPLDLRGTPFQLLVWNAVMKIPFGETWSYRDVALEAGNDRAYRAAGNAIGSNPVGIIVPCHRVVKSDGKLGGFGGDEKMKMALLDLEGASYRL